MRNVGGLWRKDETGGESWRKGERGGERFRKVEKRWIKGEKG